MQLGMIGLGRMGANMVRRLVRGGHQCVVYDRNSEAVAALATEGAIGASSLDDFVEKLQEPRIVWLMVPAAVVDSTLHDLAPLMKADDIIIDGGNSYYIDDIRRAEELKSRGIHYVDVGTSGGVWGLERGYCQMIGGETEVVQQLNPVFKTLAPGRGGIERTPGRETSGGTAADGYLHCGPSGAGHFVKMVHNGIEYGLMAAYAEGLNILHHANVGKRDHAVDAETTPLRNPEHYQYDFNLPDITELWRRGSMIASWLLDLTAIALLKQPDLENFSGRVSDSGEGRWTITAAIDESAPAPVLSAALYERFSSRGEGDFATKVLSAMRFEFGGHVEIEELALSEPFAAFNGAVIQRPDGQTLVKHLLPREIGERVLNVVADFDLDLWVYCDHDWHVPRRTPFVDREENTSGFSPVIEADIGEVLDRAAKLVVVGEPALIAEAEPLVLEAGGDEVSATKSKPRFIDITTAEAHKGTVVTQISSLLNIPTEHIAVIGDGLNDIQMFERAGFSIDYQCA